MVNRGNKKERSHTNKGKWISWGLGALIVLAIFGNTIDDEPVSPSAESRGARTATVAPAPTSPPEVSMIPDENGSTAATDDLVDRVVSAVVHSWGVDFGNPSTWEEFVSTYTVVYSEEDLDGSERVLLHGDSELWPVYVDEVRPYGEGVVEIVLSLHSGTPDWDVEEVSMYAANVFMAVAGPQNEDLKAVAVTTSDGYEMQYRTRGAGGID